MNFHTYTFSIVMELFNQFGPLIEMSLTLHVDVKLGACGIVKEYVGVGGF